MMAPPRRSDPRRGSARTSAAPSPTSRSSTATAGWRSTRSSRRRRISAGRWPDVVEAPPARRRASAPTPRSSTARPWRPTRSSSDGVRGPRSSRRPASATSSSSGGPARPSCTTRATCRRPRSSSAAGGSRSTSGSDPTAQVLIPIDEAEVRRTIAFLESEGIEAVAVCLLHSFRNPAHERTIGRLLEATSAYTSLSVDLLPVIGEYERTSTTVVNAYIGPIVSRYVARPRRRPAPDRRASTASRSCSRAAA